MDRSTVGDSLLKRGELLLAVVCFLDVVEPRVFGRPHRRLETVSLIDRMTIYAASMDDPTATS
ncbi:hypothetical protein TIFTF001_005544 [Ficus carica]|uniref:Uncharacterized protein n=1 Tax=Ficus carica TaxID=3494 RepID=A0AA87ZF59_FICCA|nr:hypothetical protein TIFTF001_005544 [Ficus carica]